MSPNLSKYYKQLKSDYGNPSNYWPQWCAERKSEEEREKIIIGMILVQRTSWQNADIALKNLKKANLLSVEKVAKLKSLEALTRLIRPAGFYRSKPKRLFDVCTFAVSCGGVRKLMKEDTKSVRVELLDIKGVGQETADTILLYALDKPVFIVDDYTRRWTEKMGITKEKDYMKLQKFFHDNLKPDVRTYQNFHALIIISQRGKEKSMMEKV